MGVSPLTLSNISNASSIDSGVGSPFLELESIFTQFRPAFYLEAEGGGVVFLGINYSKFIFLGNTKCHFVYMK